MPRVFADAELERIGICPVLISAEQICAMDSISPEAGSPARQIHDQISGLITTGRLGTGERLPSVRQLAADLEIAPGTVAKAYRSLESDGMIVSRADAGSRVREQAALVPSAVAQAARRLVSTSHREGLSLDETIRVLRTMW